MKEFRFFRKLDDDLYVKTFSCKLYRSKCPHCHRMNDMGYEYCADHLLTEMHLTIGPSTLLGAGLGLFASNGTHNRDILFQAPSGSKKYGSLITEYNGEIMTYTDMHDRYGEPGEVVMGPYTAHLNQTTVIDAACKRGVGSFANHKAKTRANAALYPHHGKIRISATKTIRNGDEIFISYGYDPLNLNKKGFAYETV